MGKISEGEKTTEIFQVYKQPLWRTPRNRFIPQTPPGSLGGDALAVLGPWTEIPVPEPQDRVKEGGAQTTSRRRPAIYKARV